VFEVKKMSFTHFLILTLFVAKIDSKFDGRAGKNKTGKGEKYFIFWSKGSFTRLISRPDFALS
jgi:hypothetical protein